MTLGKVILYCCLSFIAGGFIGVTTMCLMIVAGRVDNQN